PGGVPADTAAVLADLRPEFVIALGGDGVVPPEVLRAAGDAAGGAGLGRIAGADRYETALHIAGQAPSPRTVYVATGTNFPDALAAAPAAATHDAPIVLTDPALLPDTVATWFRETPSIQRVVILGGPNAVSPEVE